MELLSERIWIVRSLLILVCLLPVLYGPTLVLGQSPQALLETRSAINDTEAALALTKLNLWRHGADSILLSRELSYRSRDRLGRLKGGFSGVPNLAAPLTVSPGYVMPDDATINRKVFREQANDLASWTQGLPPEILGRLAITAQVEGLPKIAADKLAWGKPVLFSDLRTHGGNDAQRRKLTNFLGKIRPALHRVIDEEIPVYPIQPVPGGGTISGCTDHQNAELYHPEADGILSAIGHKVSAIAIIEFKPNGGAWIAAGSAFVTGAGYIVTPRHVLEDANVANLAKANTLNEGKELRLVFNRTRSQYGVVQPVPKSTRFTAAPPTAGKLFGSDLVVFQGNAPDGIVPIDLPTLPPPRPVGAASLMVVGYPNFETAHVSVKDFVKSSGCNGEPPVSHVLWAGTGRHRPRSTVPVVERFPAEYPREIFFYSINALGGNSGSAIFNTAGNIIGMHLGSDENLAQKDVELQRSGVNRGLFVDEIIRTIKHAQESVLGS